LSQERKRGGKSFDQQKGGKRDLTMIMKGTVLIQRVLNRTADISYGQKKDKSSNEIPT